MKKIAQSPKQAYEEERKRFLKKQRPKPVLAEKLKKQKKL